MRCSDIEASDVVHYQEVRTKEGAAARVNLEVSTLRARLRKLGLRARLQPEIRMLPERDDRAGALNT